jgi:hypothetical protein
MQGLTDRLILYLNWKNKKTWVSPYGLEGYDTLDPNKDAHAET